MRRWRALLLASALLAPVALAACVASTGPTGEEIEELLDEMLRSVAGDWSGTSGGGGVLTLAFRLEQGSGGQVTGTGTMQERGAAAAVPITITGSYQRPTLTLTLDGMVVEGRSVRGTFSGQYTSVAGIDGALVLTATGYSRQLTVLLQETRPR